MGPNYAIIRLEMKLGIKISIREGCSRGSCPSPSQQLVVRVKETETESERTRAHLINTLKLEGYANFVSENTF